MNVRGHLRQALRWLRALTRSRLGLAAALAVIALPYAYASLSLDFGWPAPMPNAARWTADGTLLLPGPGRALTPAPPPWLTWVKRTNRLEIELRVRPADTRSGTLLTISDDRLARNLVIEQRRGGVIVRLRTTCGGLFRLQRTCDATLYQRDVLQKSVWSEVRVRIEPGRLLLLTDGDQASDDLGALPLALWTDTYRLALGNEVVGTRAWQGEIAEARIRTPGFRGDYVDPAKVETETPLRPLDRVRLVPFASFDDRDVARNAIMYVPMGVAFALLGLFEGRHGTRRALLTLALFSLAMETAQMFLPERSPSVNDLILNATGGGLGFLAARFLVRRIAA